MKLHFETGFTSSDITITDNDDAPEVSIATTEVQMTETDVELDESITVTLSEASGKTVTVPYTVTAGTATTADLYSYRQEILYSHQDDSTTITDNN